MIKSFALALLAAFVLVSGPALAKKPTKKATKKTAAADSLYHRLGEKKGIAAVVDDFVGNCASDTRINSFFAATAADPARLDGFKSKLVDQICQASGGPCKYTGKTMKEAHAGMGVNDEHFTALVEDLVKALDKHHVAESDKQTLLGVLGPMKSDIVGNKG